MKTHRLDRVLISILGFVIIFIWVNYFIDGFTVSIFISFLIFLGVRAIFLHIFNRYLRLKNITVWEMSQSFAIMGAEETCKHFMQLIPENYQPRIIDNYIIFEKNHSNILIYPIFKTVAVSTEEFLKMWRLSQKNNVKTIWMLARERYRNIITLSNSLDGNFFFFSAKKIHTFLVNHNALPEKNFSRKKTKDKVKFSFLALSEIFVKRRAKYFLFSGTILAILSFFVPLTLYYLIMSTIMFGMSIACFALDR